MAGFVEITEFAGELHSEMEEIVPMKYGYIERIMMLGNYLEWLHFGSKNFGRDREKLKL